MRYIVIALLLVGNVWAISGKVGVFGRVVAPELPISDRAPVDLLLSNKLSLSEFANRYSGQNSAIAALERQGDSIIVHLN
ncbi:MAG: hypothetical protein HWE20_14905 [Gammaproteobacteria bacterium]|nr:hypothetical protein [Gammaproteobacteria bacterium]